MSTGFRDENDCGRNNKRNESWRRGNYRKLSAQTTFLLTILTLIIVPMLTGSEKNVFAQVTVTNVCTDFNSTMLTDNVVFTTLPALELFDMEGIEFLRNEIEAANIRNLNMSSFTSTPMVTKGCLLGTPDEQGTADTDILNADDFAPSLTQCAHSDTRVCVDAFGSFDEMLVKRLLLAKVRVFIEKHFNMDYADRIHVIYDFPFPVKKSIIVSLIGAKTPMNFNEQQKLRTPLFNKLKSILMQQQRQAKFRITDMEIFLQTAIVRTRRQGERRKPRQLQLEGGNGEGSLPDLNPDDIPDIPNGGGSGDNDNNGVPGNLPGRPRDNASNTATEILEFDEVPNLKEGETVEGNQVQIMINAQCRQPVDCSQEGLNEALTSQDAEAFIEDELLPILNEEAVQDYFDEVIQITLTGATGGLLNINASQIIIEATEGIPEFREEPDDIERERITWWIWVLFAVIVIVMLTGGLCATIGVIHRNEKTLIQNEFDRHQCESNHYHESANLPPQFPRADDVAATPLQPNTEGSGEETDDDDVYLESENNNDNGGGGGGPNRLENVQVLAPPVDERNWGEISTFSNTESTSVFEPTRPSSSSNPPHAVVVE